MSRPPIILEICIDSVSSAVASQEGGAQRVELCDDLAAGGTTPSAGTIEETRRRISIGLHVMIRPRGGDFCYSEEEFETMKRDVLLAKQLKADGVVFGILRPDDTIDRERMGELVKLARPMEVTCHRAIDVSRDPFESLEILADLGFDRILTSGAAPTVEEGLSVIGGLVTRSKGRVTIMSGAGVTAANVRRIVGETGLRDIHILSPVIKRSVSVGKAVRLFGPNPPQVDAAAVREFIKALPGQ